MKPWLSQWLPLVLLSSAFLCSGDEFQFQAEQLAQLLELTDPVSAERSTGLIASLSKTCQAKKSVGSTLSPAAEVFCRQVVQLAINNVLGDCSFDLLGWSARGYFDHFREQVRQDKCSEDIYPVFSSKLGVCHGKGVPLDAFRACGEELTELDFDDVFTFSSIWISASSAPGLASKMSYKIQFFGPSTNWYQEGMAVNLSSMSGWHELPVFTARKIHLHPTSKSSKRKHCVCLALRGCGRLHARQSPSFRQFFSEVYPIFGMQLLLHDMRPPEKALSFSSPCDLQVRSYVASIDWQLNSPAARLKPWDQLLNVSVEGLEDCSPVMRAKFEVAKVLLESPQVLSLTGEELPMDELQLRTALMQVVRAETFIRLAESDVCAGHVDLWRLLHRAHLRLMHRAEPPLSGWIVAHDVRTLLREEKCHGIPYTGQFGADRWALEEVFCCKRDGVYVDVGAAHSWVLSNTYAMDVFLGWQGICLDAIYEDPEGFLHTRSCKQIQQPVWSVSGETRTFLRPTNGFGFIHGWILGDNSSAENEKAAEAQVDLGEAWRFQSLKLLTTSLSDALLPFLTSRSLDAVDFLSLDIEGHEDLILESYFANPSAPLIRAVAVEVKELGKADRIQRLMEAQGYVLDRRTHPRGVGDEFWRHSSVQPC